MVVVPAHAIMLVYDISSCIVIHIYGCFMEQMTGYHCEKERTYHETVVVPQRCPATFCAAEVRHSRSGWPWRVLALTQAEQVPREKNLNISAVRACVLVPNIYIYIYISYSTIFSYIIMSYVVYSIHPISSIHSILSSPVRPQPPAHQRAVAARVVDCAWPLEHRRDWNPHGACTLW